MLNYRLASDQGYRLEASAGHLVLFRINGDLWLIGIAHALSVGQWVSLEIRGTLGHLQVLAAPTGLCSSPLSSPPAISTICCWHRAIHRRSTLWPGDSTGVSTAVQPGRCPIGSTGSPV
jgi:hypothetical protein